MLHEYIHGVCVPMAYRDSTRETCPAREMRHEGRTGMCIRGKLIGTTAGPQQALGSAARRPGSRNGHQGFLGSKAGITGEKDLDSHRGLVAGRESVLKRVGAGKRRRCADRHHPQACGSVHGRGCHLAKQESPQHPKMSEIVLMIDNRTELEGRVSPLGRRLST